MDINVRLSLDYSDVRVGDILDLADALRTLGVDREEIVTNDTETTQLIYEASPSEAWALYVGRTPNEPRQRPTGASTRPAYDTPSARPDTSQRNEHTDLPHFDTTVISDAVRQAVGDKAVRTVLDTLLNKGRGPGSSTGQ